MKTYMHHTGIGAQKSYTPVAVCTHYYKVYRFKWIAHKEVLFKTHCAIAKRINILFDKTKCNVYCLLLHALTDNRYFI